MPASKNPSKLQGPQPLNIEDLASKVVKESDTLTPVARDASTEQDRDASQRRKLRYIIAGVVVLTLWVELLFMFALLILQGYNFIQLNEWMLGIFTNGVLIQTFVGLRTIVTHLFPLNGNIISPEYIDDKSQSKKPR
jgi:hypothetical protein